MASAGITPIHYNVQTFQPCATVGGDAYLYVVISVIILKQKKMFFFLKHTL